LPDAYFIALDFPGVGYSSHYPKGSLANWKNDAFLMLKVAQELGLDHFDIIAHSYGSLAATLMAVAKPKLIGRLVFLDILGPKVNFIENYIIYLQKNVSDYLKNKGESSLFVDLEYAIRERMKSGDISYQAAQALVKRGTKQTNQGIVWTFDPALWILSSFLPHDDELIILLKALTQPLCIIRADKGVPYPEHVWQNRAAAVKNLSVHVVPGGHHVHMDNPDVVAPIISRFLFKDT